MRIYGLVGKKSGFTGHLLQALNSHLSHRAVSTLLTGKPDGIEKEMVQTSSALFRLMLRIFVDAWIESGKKEGTEHAWERTTWPELLQDYVMRNPPLLQFTGKGPALVLLPHSWDKQKELSPFLKAALATQPDVQFQDFPRKIALPAYDAAMAFFLELLDSPARVKLARCDGCGVYFCRERMPKKDMPIKRGSWCVSCKREGKDRIRRTENSRGARTDKMVELAADAWLQWKQDRRHGERTEWVARKVNKRLQASWTPIKKNWVTGHKDEIEAEVERRSHAAR
jgi:hypothetical protein